MYGEPENRVTIPRFWENSVTHLPLSRNLGCVTRLHTILLYNVWESSRSSLIATEELSELVKPVSTVPL